jgi:acyl-coenzyme A synthetase/AMP-(fatty) acid ligase
VVVLGRLIARRTRGPAAAITDTAVIGVTDDAGEEIPKAFAVRRPGTDLTADEVIEFVARQVAPSKKVRRVEFIDAIPKSASGKILRKDLRTPAV